MKIVPRNKADIVMQKIITTASIWELFLLFFRKDIILWFLGLPGESLLGLLGV